MVVAGSGIGFRSAVVRSFVLQQMAMADWNIRFCQLTVPCVCRRISMLLISVGEVIPCWRIRLPHMMKKDSC